MNDIFKIDENALTGFRAQVYDGRVALDGAEIRFEHQIEFAHGGITVLAAHGTVDGVLVDKRFHLFVRHRIHRLLGLYVVRSAKIFDELIRAKTRFAFGAVDHRIGKMRNVSARFPRRVVHEDRRVETYDIVVELRHLFPPRVLNIAFEFDAERPVIPRARLPAVNFTRLIYKTAPLAQTDDFIKRASVIRFRHSRLPYVPGCFRKPQSLKAPVTKNY